MPIDTAKVLDSGQKSVRFTVVADADPDQESSFHVPAETLAHVAGVHRSDPCLMGTLAHTIEIEKVDAPFHMGIVAKSGDEALGGTATHHLLNKHEAGSYHAVAGEGINDFSKDPIKIDVSHDSSDVHGTVMQMVKRGTRWEQDVGKSAVELMRGLQTHEGTSSNGQVVKRALVPLHGDHPCTRALVLNENSADGPFSQYNAKNRKTIKIDGQENIIVEKDHLVQMAKTLEDNLKPTTQLGKNGVTLHFKPMANLDSTKASPGKVIVDLKLKKHTAQEVIQNGADHDYSSELSVLQKLTSGQASSIISGGGDAPAVGAKAADSPDNLATKILSTKLVPMKPQASAQLSLVTSSTEGEANLDGQNTTSGLSGDTDEED